MFDRVDDVGATIAGTLAVQLPAAWVHTVATTSPAQQGAIRIGRTVAQLPHDEVLARARTAAARNLPAPTPENKPSDSDETADQVADYVLALFLPRLERAPVPPSFIPPHGYEWCALTPMEFTEMEGWPDGVSEAEPSRTPTPRPPCNAPSSPPGC